MKKNTIGVSILGNTVNSWQDETETPLKNVLKSERNGTQAVVSACTLA